MLPVTKTPLTAPQEAFAIHYATYGAPVDAYRHAYNVTTTNVLTMRTAASRLLAHPGVSARVTTLRNAAADAEGVSKARLIQELEAMVEVDLNDLMQLHVVACSPECWPAQALAEAFSRALVAGDALPDPGAPNPACSLCHGAGRAIGRMANTADLPLAARRLFKGIQFYPDGGVKQVLVHDQTMLRVELHKLKGMHVDRSVSLNINADFKPLKPMSLEETLAAIATLVPTTDSSVVSEQ